MLFTGVVDETGERVLARLGGSVANGTADMNCLVADKVRRTVKFMCAVAKGIPIVNIHWLDKVGHGTITENESSSVRLQGLRLFVAERQSRELAATRRLHPERSRAGEEVQFPAAGVSEAGQ